MTMKKEMDLDKQYAIFDLDGTLADVSPREIWAIAGDWDEFNSRCIYDAPKDAMLALCNALYAYKGWGTIILTGRSDKWERDTLYWLKLVGVDYDGLIMRPEGNEDSDFEFKRIILNDLRARGVDIRMAFDDRDGCIDMFNEEGIWCFKAGESAY